MSLAAGRGTTTTQPAADRNAVITHKLGLALVAENQLSESRLREICRATPSKPRPGWRLVDAGVLSEVQWSERIASLFGVPNARLEDFSVDRTLIERVPEHIANRYELLPLVNNGAEIYVAVSDPTALTVFDHLRGLLGSAIQPIVVPPSELERALENYYLVHDVSDIEHIEPGTLDDLSAAEIEHLRDAGESGHIVELVDRLMAHAISIGASDIHIEPLIDRLVVRFRVDGMLRPGPSYSAQLSPWVVSRIKVLAQLDISERFVPQDGRVKLRMSGREIDMRISSVPVVHGEKVVIRLLGTGNVKPSLKDVGFTGTSYQQLLGELKRPQGMVLVTGPTGSGKSTTLYASLLETATPEINVVTIEDPVEYEVRGINQVPVNPKRGITFALALRAILRQDPDVILVGEIRDNETGMIAAEAAMTGHLLLSTLHTNSALATVQRLVELGVPRHLIAPSLNAIVAQRLMRKLCSQCCKSYKAAPRELSRFLPDFDASGLTLKRAVGCGVCEGTGYRGRMLIHELLVIDDELRTLIGTAAHSHELAAAAKRKGFRELAESGLELVASGATSLEELYRVVGSTQSSHH